MAQTLKQIIPHFLYIPLVMSKFHLVSFPELLLYGTDCQEYAPLSITILVSSNKE